MATYATRTASQLVGSWAYGAAVASGLDAELLTKPCTVFVPSDEAVKSYVAASHAATADLATESGKAAVSAHVIPNVQLAFADIPEGSTSYNTLAGVPLIVTNNGGLLSVTCGGISAKVIKTDVVANNAILFLIDGVLMPV